MVIRFQIILNVKIKTALTVGFKFTSCCAHLKLNLNSHNCQYSKTVRAVCTDQNRVKIEYERWNPVVNIINVLRTQNFGAKKLQN